MQRLSKGANAAVPSSAVRVLLTWSAETDTPDVDVSAVLCQSDGSVGNDDDFVFFNQSIHPSGSVRHTGRRNTGGTAADSLVVDLSTVPAPVERVVVAASADGTFDRVPHLRVTVFDAFTGEPLLGFPIAGHAETAMIAGEMYRRNGGWKFRAVGQGYNDGLAGLARDFGITVDDPLPTDNPPASSPSPPAPLSRTSPGPTPEGTRIDWMNPPVPRGYEI